MIPIMLSQNKQNQNQNQQNNNNKNEEKEENDKKWIKNRFSNLNNYSFRSIHPNIEHLCDWRNQSKSSSSSPSISSALSQAQPDVENTSASTSMSMSMSMSVSSSSEKKKNSNNKNNNNNTRDSQNQDQNQNQIFRNYRSSRSHRNIYHHNNGHNRDNRKQDHNHENMRANVKYKFKGKDPDKSEQTSSTREKRRCYSYGIICKKFNDYHYIVQNRKYSIGFEQFIKSRWELKDVDFILQLLNDMSLQERGVLFTVEYYKLWLRLHFSDSEKEMDALKVIKPELDMDLNFMIAEQKFKALIRGYWYNSQTQNIIQTQDIIQTNNVNTDTNSEMEIQTKLQIPVPVPGPGPGQGETRVQTDSLNFENASWVTLAKLCDVCTTNYEQTALEFPKGKKNKYRDHESKMIIKRETNLEAAQREFMEETGIPMTEYTILTSVFEKLNHHNHHDDDHQRTPTFSESSAELKFSGTLSPLPTLPSSTMEIEMKMPTFEESFIGLNGRQYVYIYYIAQLNSDSIWNDENQAPLEIDPNNLNQVNEIGHLKWATKDEIVNEIRPNNLRRQEIICQVDSLFSSLLNNQTNQSINESIN